MAKGPFLGVPEGDVRVENPDGVYNGDMMSHSLYDSGNLNEPIIPGDVDYAVDVPMPGDGTNKLHPGTTGG